MPGEPRKNKGRTVKGPVGERAAKYTAVDLFSGAGGMTLGLKQAGFSVIGAVELDSLAVETYRSNHPEVKVWRRDIRDLTLREVRRTLGVKQGELDLLAACPPCQGFSRMRTLNRGGSVTDERNDLISEVLRFVRGLRPRSVMLENVPGLREDRRFRDFCEQLAKLGYTYTFEVVDAADYGVPQRRRRLLLLASRNGAIRMARRSTVQRTVRWAIGNLPPAGESGDALHDLPESRTRRVRNLIRRVPKDGGSRAAAGRHYRLRCHRECDGFNDVYGRMAWDAVAPTITSGCVNPSKGRFLHPQADRAMTVREAALLQSFPPSYSFALTSGKFRAAELIGNALPPELVRRHARSVAKALGSPGPGSRSA